MKKIILMFVISVSLVVSSHAATLKSENDTKALADEFMQEISKGSCQGAFEKMKPQWPMPEAEINNLAYQTETQLKMASDRFGKLLGVEFIQSNRIGESYIRHIYIQKFANHATRWMVVFYRPLDEWKVNIIVWDDRTHELFDLSGEQTH
ncbi:hypothetical protein ACFL5J_01965 [Thermodesulfobacteriota bacterium]